MPKLAIVIPAFKGRFLDATLRSIAEQTCRDFVVYVGDDASPDDLAAICARWQGQLDLRYTRFDDNLGGHDLTAQWQRCIGLSVEPWIWLFGDDDLMPPNGVALFLEALQRPGAGSDLFHFDVEKIGSDGELLVVEPAFPEVLRSRDFAIQRFRFRLSSYAPDYVFSRAVYDATGGFEAFPLAWCSDDASWIKFACASGIRTIAGAKVQWRLSSDNISAHHPGRVQAKTEALVQFLCWLDAFLVRHPAAAGEPSDATVLRWGRTWFFAQARIMKLRFFPWSAFGLLWRLGAVRGFSRVGLLLRMVRADWQRATRSAGS